MVSVGTNFLTQMNTYFCTIGNFHQLSDKYILLLITISDVEADEVDDVGDDDVRGKGSPCCCFQVYYYSGEMNTDVDKGAFCRYTYWIQMNLNIVICGKAGPQRDQRNCTTWLLHGQNWSLNESVPKPRDKGIDPIACGTNHFIIFTKHNLYQFSIYQG